MLSVEDWAAWRDWSAVNGGNPFGRGSDWTGSTVEEYRARCAGTLAPIWPARAAADAVRAWDALGAGPRARPERGLVGTPVVPEYLSGVPDHARSRAAVRRPSPALAVLVGGGFGSSANLGRIRAWRHGVIAGLLALRSRRAVRLLGLYCRCPQEDNVAHVVAWDPGVAWTEADAALMLDPAHVRHGVVGAYQDHAQRRWRTAHWALAKARDFGPDAALPDAARAALCARVGAASAAVLLSTRSLACGLPADLALCWARGLQALVQAVQCAE